MTIHRDTLTTTADLLTLQPHGEGQTWLLTAYLTEVDHALPDGAQLPMVVTECGDIQAVRCLGNVHQMLGEHAVQMHSDVGPLHYYIHDAGTEVLVSDRPEELVDFLEHCGCLALITGEGFEDQDGTKI